jgi:hypothetical protein
VAVRPAPRLVTGRLSPADAQAVFQSASLNEAALVAHWLGAIGTTEFARRLQPLSPAVPP